MTIDWSKAPEGATHWDSRGNACSLGFMKPGLRTGEWEYAGCGGHWVLYGRADMNLINAMIPRPEPWTGEGPPPVGTVCRLKSLEGPLGEGSWGTAEILYSNKHAIVWRWQGHPVFEFGANFGDVKCEPIPTPEQIAAEEREAAIDKLITESGIDFGAGELMSPLEYVRSTLAALHDLGYRKVEGGAA